MARTQPRRTREHELPRLKNHAPPEKRQRAGAVQNLLARTVHGKLPVALVNPFACIKDLFTRLPAAKISRIKEFTPSAWAKAQAKEKLLAQDA